MTEEDLQALSEDIDFLFESLKRKNRTEEEDMMIFFTLGEMKGLVIKDNPKIIGFTKDADNEKGR